MGLTIKHLNIERKEGESLEQFKLRVVYTSQLEEAKKGNANATEHDKLMKDKLIEECKKKWGRDTIFFPIAIHKLGTNKIVVSNFEKICWTI